MSLDDPTLPVICPTVQIQIFNERATKKIRQIETDFSNSHRGNEKARCRFTGAGRIIFAMMSICL
jgi:hypothetical protein